MYKSINIGAIDEMFEDPCLSWGAKSYLYGSGIKHQVDNFLSLLTYQSTTTGQMQRILCKKRVFQCSMVS